MSGPTASSPSIVPRLAKHPFSAALLAVSAFLAWRLMSSAAPWHVAGADRLHEGAKAQLAYFMPAGLWWGSAVALILVLAAFVVWAWCSLQPASPLTSASKCSIPRWFWIALFCFTLAGLPQRWERLHQCFWGDEANAFPFYVHGRWAPMKGGDGQGSLRFIRPDWSLTFWADNMGGGGNNHYLMSILSRLGHEFWQKMAHKNVAEFSEAGARWPAFAAGLLLPVVLAWMMARRGFAAAGVIAAALLILHPWHLRFTTEHRGYTLVALFLLLCIEAMARALDRGRWPDWSLLAVCEFLALYSWKAAAFPLLLMNGWLVVLVLRDWRGGRSGLKESLSIFGRRMVSGLLMSALFIQLYLPCQMQIKYLRSTGGLWGGPMDFNWLKETVAQFFLGMNWRTQQPEFAGEISIMRMAEGHACMLWASAILALAFIVMGSLTLLRRNGIWSGFFLAIPLSLLIAALVFKTLLTGMEFLDWYFFAALPVLTALAAVGIWSMASRLPPAAFWALTTMFVLGFGWITSPAREALMSPRQDYAGACRITRGDWNVSSMRAESKIYTLYLQQYAPVYDPRAERDVEDAEKMRKLARRAQAAGGEFFTVVGNLHRCRVTFAESTRLVEDARLFELKEILWAQDVRQTLRVYRWRGVDF